MKTNVDKDWFTAQLRARKTTQRALAQHMGIDASAVSLLLDGRRRLQLPQAQEMADFLGVDVAEVLAHAGVRIAARPGSAPQPTRVRMVGSVDARMIVRLDKGSVSVEGHPALPVDVVAVRAQTAGSALDFMDGWVLFFQPSRAVAAELVAGRLAIVEDSAGTRHIGTLRRGYADGAHNLLLPGGGLLEDMRVASAAPVLWIRP
jgi:hypothetical protein